MRQGGAKLVSSFKREWDVIRFLHVMLASKLQSYAQAAEVLRNLSILRGMQA